MTSYLITTRLDDNDKDISSITLKNLKWYAQKCQADFEIISDCKNLHHHYRIMQFYDLFEKYDRILSLDADILILKNCPNIFNYVPKEKIGTVFEDKGSRQLDRRNRIKKIQDKFGDVNWNEGYINTGFAVFSKMHREIFKHTENLWLDLGYDDVFLGWKINKLGLKIEELPHKFNHMSMFSENNGPSRFDSFCIHYAGQGGFHPFKSRLNMMKEDYLILKKYGLIEEV